jgi:hypothetical protein
MPIPTELQAASSTIPTAGSIQRKVLMISGDAIVRATSTDRRRA